MSGIGDKFCVYGIRSQEYFKFDGQDIALNFNKKLSSEEFYKGLIYTDRNAPEVKGNRVYLNIDDKREEIELKIEYSVIPIDFYYLALVICMFLLVLIIKKAKLIS